MLILGLDLETQSLAKETKITEIGGGLYEPTDTFVMRGNRKKHLYTKKIGFSHFCYEPDYQPQTEEIVELTGITDLMLKSKGHSRAEVLVEVFEFMKKADIIMAHNKAFDEEVLKSTCSELKLEMPKKEWICTMTDVDWPKKYRCKSLQHMALYHGITVNPEDYHRAENDVDLMMEVIALNNLNEILEYAREPWVLVKAKIRPPWNDNGGDGGVQKEIAQRLGFTYERIPYLDNVVEMRPKTWIKRIKKSKVEPLTVEIQKSISPFELEII